MTISSTTRIAGPFVGNGTATVLPFTFKVFAAADLNVVRLTTSTGVETTLVLNSDYSVTLNGDQNSNPGGSITLLAGALATGYTIVITSDIANLQPTDLTNQGGFYPEVITDALDRATIQIQQISDIGERALRIPITDGSLNMELPTAAERANSFLSFDANGLPSVVTAGSSGAPATITRQVFSGTGSQTVFTLASDPGALGNSAQVYIGGVYQQRSTYTIAGTTLTFSSAPVAGTDNIEFVNFLTSNIGSTSADLVTYTPTGTGAVARSAASKFGEVVSVKDFGAVGNGTTDDTAAITAAIAAVSVGGVLFFPAGTYRTTSTITIQKNISWIMEGGSYLNYVTASNTPAVFFDYPMNNVDIVMGVNRATLNWASGADGIKFVDMIDSRLSITSAINHRRGLALDASAATGFGAGSIAYNKFTLGKIWNNKFGVFCESSGGAFINTNDFRSGRFTLTPAVSAAMTEEAFGIYHKNSGTTTYFAPSLEGVGNATYKFVFVHFDTGAKWNTLLQPYIESDPTSVIMRVSDTAKYNRIVGHMGSSTQVSVNAQVEEMAGLVNPGTNILDWNSLDNVSLFRGGLQEIFPVTDVYSNTVQTTSGANGNLLAPGFVYQVRSTVSDDYRLSYQTGSNHYLSDGFLSLGDAALGKFIDSRNVKRFWLSAAKIAGHGGTNIVFVVKAYDSLGTKITTAGAVSGNVTNLDTESLFAVNADYGGSYTVTSAVDSKCFFAVSSSVATIWIGVAPSAGNFIGISGISLKCDADLPPPLAYPDYRRVNATYMDLDEEGVSTTAPLGGVIKDGRVWNIVQASATSQGWWTAARLSTTSTASAAAGATAITAASVSGVTASDIIGIVLTEASTSNKRWHWTTVTSVAGSTINFTSLAIPAGYSAANGTQLLTYRVVNMPNNA